MSGVFFIDSDGNRISCDKISSHIGLANEIIKRDEKLAAEYEKVKGHDIVDFLIENQGYMKIDNSGFYKEIEYYGPKTSPRQKKIIMAYYEQGYCLLDLARNKAKEQEIER